MEGISDAGRGIVDWINNIRRGQWYSSAVVDMDSAPIEFPTFKLYVVASTIHDSRKAMKTLMVGEGVPVGELRALKRWLVKNWKALLAGSDLTPIQGGPLPTWNTGTVSARGAEVVLTIGLVGNRVALMGAKGSLQSSWNEPGQVHAVLPDGDSEQR